MKAWNPNDKSDKRFVQIYKSTPIGYMPITIQELVIGQPCILELPSGRLIQTSPVQSWTIYGHTEIRTKSRIYYLI